MKTMQAPISSPFNAHSTTTEIAAEHDLHGKTVVVTGGNSGIGFETVKTLAGIGAKVIVGARDISKVQDKLSALPNVSFIPLDLADPASVDSFAEQFFLEQDTLHLLFNNAGIFRPPQFLTDKRGYEIQFGVNHLGHFQLTGLLWPALKKAGKARVIVLSSVGHRRMDVQLDDLNFERQGFDTMKAYGQSKTANILFAVELNRLGNPFGISAFAVHPGAIQTDIFRYMSAAEVKAWSDQVKQFKTPEQGAATAVWCALSEQLEDMGGVYCEDCNIAELLPDDSPAPYGVRAFALDTEKARSLWVLSEQITGHQWP
ncbi:NAD(P)-dependent dehydrogenase (short-subunit alcohol dehydrogenase family) [Chitinophaga dinghuensis]|uniref:NAD(P)-dependent dehydrogenase (Short-subunit alcohol dehydrogenase family) n=1 Tax=Chitinophaga dinghuensis TaxID=1539050 RepID=A0A327VRT1_9BACT|nr:SDR family NAD(P)-dependent oxidoreductase [Chitinophaga dinghuensis]RAJ76760.1 NAD(P)-dependent dehydrogenase (short-subunit alcohol dehydrogenase family) [Chitinophaga dinghuensis]